MKKLEKLTLKEMSDQMTLISPSEQPLAVGGSDSGFTSAQDVWNYIWGEAADELSPAIDAISSTFGTIEEAGNDFENWVEDNNVLEIAAAGGVALTDLILTLLGFPATGGMPIVTPSDSDSGSYIGSET